MKFEGVEMFLQKGDVITSKNGILFPDSPLTGKAQLVKKAEYLGDGKWVTVEKRYVDAEKDP